MAQGTRICKVCGKEYPYCKTFTPADVFRWQDVACCAEHGAEYFAQIEASRNKKPVSPQKNTQEQAQKAPDKKSNKKDEKKIEKKSDNEDSDGFQPKED